MPPNCLLVDPDETRNWYQRQVLLPTWKIRQVGPGNTEECGSWLPQVATKVAEGLLPSSLGTLEPCSEGFSAACLESSVVSGWRLGCLVLRGGKWSAEATTSALLRKVPLEESSGSPRTRHSSREPSTLEIPKGALGRWPRGRGWPRHPCRLAVA